MLANPMQYLKSRNAAYAAIAASAGPVYNGALYQIALSVTSFKSNIPFDDATITARATAIFVLKGLVLIMLCHTLLLIKDLDKLGGDLLGADTIVEHQPVLSELQLLIQLKEGLTTILLLLLILLLGLLQSKMQQSCSG